jgi:hypothetical protein
VADADTRAGATLAVGGGVDFRVIGRLSLRTGADYMPAFLGPQLPGGPRVQQQLRLTIGVKFHCEVGPAGSGARLVNRAKADCNNAAAACPSMPH